MTLLLEMFTYPFIVRAFAAGVLLSLCAALLGVPLVLKRYSMIGDGLSHVSFGALSVALACGWAPLPVSIPVVIVAALGLLLRSLHRRFRPSGGNETLKVLLVCFFTCGILLHLPMYAAAYAGEHLSWLKALLGAVHHTLRMFVLDGELDPIHEFAMSRPAVWSDLYFGAAIVVYLVSPLLTFSVVLSFFKNLSALWRYAFRRCTELYVFSELNEDSLYLAGSIKAAHPKGLVVFTDVYENESEEFGEQMAAAHRLGAACFKTDIALLRLRRSDRSRPVYFFLMGRDKAENIHQAVLLTRRWGTRSNMHLYLFATGAESELLFQSADPRGMRIRRVNEVRSLVQLLLYQQGEKLFETAAPLPEGRHQISALLLGLGQYGTEMLKALAWFGQMDGYDLRLTAVDARPNARELFTYRCPELMDRRHNGQRIPGEAQYDIRIHAGMRLESREFLELVQTLPQLTYVFVALGSDTRNIEAAVRLGGGCQRRGLPSRWSTRIFWRWGRTPSRRWLSPPSPTTGVPHTTFIFWAHGICCTPRATSSTPGWKQRR